MAELTLTLPITAAEAERLLYLATFEHCGSRHATALALGVSLTTVKTKLRSYGVPPGQNKAEKDDGCTPEDEWFSRDF